MQANRVSTNKMIPRKSRALAALLVVIALSAGFAAQSWARSNGQAADLGAKWLTKSPLSGFAPGLKADAISALAASGTKKSKIDLFADSLEIEANTYAITAGSTAKIILAAVAARRNPRCFGPDGYEVDFVGLLNDLYSEKDKKGKTTGQFGQTGFDQALSMLALKAAGEKIPSKSKSLVWDRRGKNGWGFAFTDGVGDDTETTALMIEAQIAAGASTKDDRIATAWKWIRYQQNDAGGYNPNGGAGAVATQANTTAYVLRAADALNGSQNRAEKALRALQKRSGLFKSEPTVEGDHRVATVDAVTALSDAHYPVVKRSAPGKSCAS